MRVENERLLEKYVTNSTGQVFAIIGLEGIVGAVMARYSRAQSGLRETLLREFVNADRLKLEKADKLIERVLVAYGDDSVGELEGAHLSFEDISLLATKVIEHRRIGGSPIEQSTRYVRYDFKREDGAYHYYIPRVLGDGPGRVKFTSLMDNIFGNYSAMWEPMSQFLERSKPMGEASYDLGKGPAVLADMKTPKQIAAFKRTYRMDLKTKTCDVLRAFLPLSARANVGLFGNGRFFQHLISKMLTSELAEANDLGGSALEELTKIIPHYVKRAAKLDYVSETAHAMKDLVPRYFSDLTPCREPGVSLLEPDHAFMLKEMGANPTAQGLDGAYRLEQDLNFITSLVYAYADGSFQAIRERVKELPRETWWLIMDTYYGKREVRRNRPERGVEHGYAYTFDLVTEWAVYKDLMRHRMATIQVQPLAPNLGFEMPWELADAGLGKVAEETVAHAEELYAYLNKHHPETREYAVLQGHRVRWMLGINDRALMHMLELRTAPQGHPNYRLTCQQMHDLALARFPQRASRMKFVNHDLTYWSRGDSEARQRVKEADLEDT